MAQGAGNGPCDKGLGFNAPNPASPLQRLWEQQRILPRNPGVSLEQESQWISMTNQRGLKPPPNKIKQGNAAVCVCVYGVSRYRSSSLALSFFLALSFLLFLSLSLSLSLCCCGSVTVAVLLSLCSFDSSLFIFFFCLLTLFLSFSFSLSLSLSLPPSLPPSLFLSGLCLETQLVSLRT